MDNIINIDADKTYVADFGFVFEFKKDTERLDELGKKLGLDFSKAYFREEKSDIKELIVKPGSTDMKTNSENGFKFEWLSPSHRTINGKPATYGILIVKYIRSSKQ
jgi:hypothetical protein